MIKEEGKMENRIAYISGPITGVPDYKERFAAAADALMDQGFTVINPANMDGVLAGPGADHTGFLRADMKLLELADVLVLLPGWTESKGAMAEYHKAVRLGKQIAEAKEKEATA